MKKDKPSKKKVNPEKSEIQNEIKQEESDSLTLEKSLVKLKNQIFQQNINILLNHPGNIPNLLIKTFKTLPPRNLKILLNLITKICEFGIACTDPIWLFEGSREQITEERKSLYSKRAEIYDLLTELIPKETKPKVPSEQFIRLCKNFPKTLSMWVNSITSTLKFCLGIVNKERKSKTKSKRKKTVEIFLERELDSIYDVFCEFIQDTQIKPCKKETLKNMPLQAVCENSVPETALRILSFLANCSYDSLHELYYAERKSRKK